MRRHRLLALILVFTCAGASATELPGAKIEAIDRLVKAFMATNGVAGLSIAVVADGQLQWSSGYGLADAENSVKATAVAGNRSGAGRR